MPTGGESLSGLISFFDSGDPALDAFGARVPGLFAEDAVRAWCHLPDSPYEALLGRPTLKMPGRSRGHTLDFILRRRGSASYYVAELKAWPAFERGRFAVLDDPAKVDRAVPYSRAAMEVLLRFARDPSPWNVTADGKPIPCVEGAILIWASVTPDGRAKTIERYGFADVLGLDRMVAVLAEQRPADWLDYIGARRRVCEDLFDLVTGQLEVGDE